MDYTFIFVHLVFMQLSSSVAFTYDLSDYGQITTTNLRTGLDSGTYAFAVATFGPKINSNDQGILYLADPPEACRVVQPPPTGIPSGYGWIALVKRSRPNTRGSCNFIEKVLNAQVAGYSYVIVYNYEPDDGELEKMDAPNNATLRNSIKIPSVFVDYEDGHELKSVVDENMTAAYFQTFESGINPYKILLPMAFSFVGILLITCIVMIIRWCQAIRKRRKSRISKSQLKKIPIKKYNKDDQYDCCVICLDDYEEGEKLRVLPCAHTFHQKCIDPWLLKNKRTCPVCKRKVIPKPARRSRRADSSDSSDTNDEGGADERTPLLPPPAGSQTHSSPPDPELTHSRQFYGSGLPASTQNDVVYESEEPSEDESTSSSAAGYPHSKYRPFPQSYDDSDSCSDGQPRGVLIDNQRPMPSDVEGAAHSLHTLDACDRDDLVSNSLLSSSPGTQMISGSSAGPNECNTSNMNQTNVVV